MFWYYSDKAATLKAAVLIYGVDLRWRCEVGIPEYSSIFYSYVYLTLHTTIGKH